MEAGIVGVLVCLGSDVADRGMDPCTVVEGLDGGEDGLTSSTVRRVLKLLAQALSWQLPRRLMRMVMPD